MSLLAINGIHPHDQHQNMFVKKWLNAEVLLITDVYGEKQCCCSYLPVLLVSIRSKFLLSLSFFCNYSPRSSHGGGDVAIGITLPATADLQDSESISTSKLNSVALSNNLYYAGVGTPR